MFQLQLELLRTLAQVVSTLLTSSMTWRWPSGYNSGRGRGRSVVVEGWWQCRRRGTKRDKEAGA
jgi:hypothetical protein